jgi:hypothetical protein
MNQMNRHRPGWLQSDVFGTFDPRSMWPVSRLHQEMNRLFGEASRGLDDAISPAPAARRTEVGEERPAAGPE